MVDEIARLGVAVDSSPAVSASKDLETLAAAGDRATQSTRNLSQSWEGARFSPEKMFGLNRSLRAYRESLTAARNAQNEVDQSWKKITFSDRQLYSLNQSLNRYKQELQAAKTAAAALVPTQKIVADSHHQVAKAAAGYTKTAKELAFANRNLPAQFTDIAVSLQAGQNPLTVLLQQGGQLKDMYGGIGPAVQAMGRYLMGLVNPYTLAAAGAVALAVAWKQGEAESVGYQRALAEVGHRVGVTAEQLQLMAQNMESGTITQGAASKALIEVARSGKIAGSGIELVATAALNMERATGRAVKDTVAEFEELGRSPVEASVKLNEQTGYLTQAVYEQIKALEEQGRTSEAARVAQAAYAEEVNKRSTEMLQSLGLLEKGFHYLKIGASAAWDAVAGIGRPDSGAENFNKLHKELLRSQELAAAYGDDVPDWLQKRIDSHKAAMKVLSDANVRETREAGRRQLERTTADYAIQLDQEARLYDTNAEKRTRMVRERNERHRRAVLDEERKGGADLAQRLARLRVDHEKVIAGIQERYKDPKVPKSKAETEAERAIKAQAREYAQLDKVLQQHDATLRAAGESQSRLTSFERYAVKLLSDLESGHSLLSPEQKEEIRNRVENLRVLDAENTERERQAKALAIAADLTNRLNKAEEAQKFSMNRELRGMTMGRDQAALQNALEDIGIRATQERIALAERMGAINSDNSQEYMDALREIGEAEQRQLDNELEHWDRRRAAMSDWRNGARAAMDEIEMASWDVAGQTKDAYLTAFGAMNNAIAEFSRTGKANIRDMATVIIAELTRIALTIALSKALTGMFGGTSVDASASMNVGSAYPGVSAAARGAVLANGMLTSFARGGIRTSPTLMPMANGGTMLMSEQAPEAIMPLARGPDGKLGVRAGGGGGTTINVSTNVVVNADGSGSSSTSVAGDSDQAMVNDAKQMAAALEAKVQEVLIKEQRQGGILWNMKNRG